VGTAIIEESIATEIILNMYVNAKDYIFSSVNICAETTKSETQNTIIIGSHLDSAKKSPGINDNASGSSANLEIAILFSNLGKTKNKLKFCWWSADELGFGGSYFFLKDQSDADRKLIIANVNIDVIASPNKFHGIFDATTIWMNPNVKIKSTYIMNLFVQHMITQKQPYDLVPYKRLSVGSGPFYEFGHFIDFGIPSCSMYAGVNVIKTSKMRSKYGGIANAKYDPCYHLPCDDINNIDMTTFLLIGNAYFNVVENLSNWLGQ